MVRKIVSFCLMLNLGLGSIAFASDFELLENRILKLENDMNKESSVTKVFDGLRIGGGATYILQTTKDANNNLVNNVNDQSVTDTSYSVDLEIEKSFGNSDVMFIHLETGDGLGLEDELDVFSNVNRDADDSDNGVSVTEAWYEHVFESAPLTFTFGKIDASAFIDTNEYANDECGQFLGHVFRNSPAIVFPDDNALGLRVLSSLSENLEWELLGMDGKGDGEDLMDNMFLATQINIKPNLLDRDGNYRVYAWMNNKDFVKWDDASKNTESNYGLGVSIDQKISDCFGVFARYGLDDEDVYVSGESFALANAWSCGVQLSGEIWSRDADVLGIAFGQLEPSSKYKESTANLKANNEQHFEVYYNISINDNLVVSPILHYINEPFGGDASEGSDSILVGGIRTQISF